MGHLDLAEHSLNSIDGRLVSLLAQPATQPFLTVCFVLTSSPCGYAAAGKDGINTKTGNKGVGGVSGIGLCGEEQLQRVAGDDLGGFKRREAVHHHDRERAQHVPLQHAHVHSDVGQIAGRTGHRGTPVAARNPPRGHVSDSLLFARTIHIETGGGYSQLLSHVQVGNHSELNGHLFVDATGAHGRNIEVGEGREGLVHLRLEEVAEGPAIHERLAGRVLGRVVVDYPVVKTVHLLQLFDQDRQVGNAHTFGSNALLSDATDVFNNDVGVSQKTTIV